MMKKYSIFVALISTLLMVSAAHAGKILKWVDENGKVHYGDKPPMPTDSTNSKVLNEQGVTVRSIDNERHEVKRTAADRARSRKDEALLASYNSAEEIDLAKERNTRIDKVALKSLEEKLAQLDASLMVNIKKQGTYRSKEEAIPEKLLDEEKSIVSQITTTKTEIAAKQANIAETEQRYDNDKKRYLELKPRVGAIGSIREKERALVDLKKWRDKAQANVRYYQNKAVRLKRSGDKMSEQERKDYLRAARELNRANAAVRDTEAAIQAYQDNLSQ